MRKRTPAALAGTLALGLALGLGSASAAAAGTAGSLDPTFGHGGVVLTNLNGGAGDAALQANGDIVVAGGFGLARYLPNGTLDTSFGVRGLAQLPAAIGLGDFGPALAVQPDGKYVWAGATASTEDANAAFGAVRFNANGTVDQTFGTGGVATTSFPNSGVQGADTVLVQPDGKILLGGEIFPDINHAPPEGALARFNANGTVDQTFGTGGVATTSFPNSSVQGADTALVQPDGKILLGGEVLPNVNHAPPEGALARFDANGTPDQAFGHGGQVLSTAAVGEITALGLDAAGDIFVLPAHAEFTAEGQPDATVTPAPITTSSHGEGATFLASGGYVLATSPAVAKHDDDIQVQRFNADGTVAATSPAFDYSGATGFDQALDSAHGVAVQPNGQIVVDGGHFAGGSSPIGLARVNGNGS
ncbi:MAG: hypothetical protein JO132_05545, partial [Streptosporangiaceae bacterium]|nr:hypothetical protein [Streptosporangiaceae bacterium]